MHAYMLKLMDPRSANDRGLQKSTISANFIISTIFIYFVEITVLINVLNSVLLLVWREYTIYILLDCPIGAKLICNFIFP